MRHTKYPYQYPALDAVLNKAPPASFASGATALGAALTQAWAVAALIMSASPLLPLGPLDGAHVGKAGAAAAAGVVGGALLVGLGLI